MMSIAQRVAVLLIGLATGAAAVGAPATDDPEVAKLAKEVRNKGWIMYGVTTLTGDMDLYVMRPDGSDQRRITHTPGFYEGAPRFSPDGKKVLYRKVSTKTKLHHNYWGYQGKIVIANADGSDPVTIGKEGQYPWASWSPDGKQISILTRRGIQIVDLATKKVVRTLPRKGMYQQLFWSPDGKWFCGVTNALGESWTVARLNAETGEINGVRKAADTTEETAPDPNPVGWMGAECTPDWFPDSKHILFSHRPRAREGRSWTQLWMAQGDGKRQRMVYGEAGRHIYGGTLSPDAKYILFSRVWMDGGGGLLSGTHMGLARFPDGPSIGGKNKQLMRSQYPDSKDAVVLELPLGWEPTWTYADLSPKQGQTATRSTVKD